jgi:hypothetical protein
VRVDGELVAGCSSVIDPRWQLDELSVTLAEDSSVGGEREESLVGVPAQAGGSSADLEDDLNPPGRREAEDVAGEQVDDPQPTALPSRYLLASAATEEPPTVLTPMRSPRRAW